ncbi:Barstar (fragment) [Moraxellaceae bacterium 17A]|mgnify:CR=1 FL=1
MEIEIRGNEIFSDKDFHNQLAKALNVEQYYGKNLDALWDLLSFNIERPLNYYLAKF